MNLKISVGRQSTQRMPRQAARENRPAPFASYMRPTPAPFPNYSGEQRIDSLRHQQVKRVAPRAAIRKVAEPQPGLLGRAFSWLRGGAAAEKQLRVIETVQLGEKRIVAIVEAEGRRYLIGCGSSGVSLLTKLAELEEESGRIVTAHSIPVGAEIAE